VEAAEGIASDEAAIGQRGQGANGNVDF